MSDDGIKSELHKVPGTPFVDWKPKTDEAELIRFMMGPMADIAARIDIRLNAIESKIAALALRVATLESDQRVADEQKAKRRRRRENANR